ncbi:sulfite reductase subunit alpha [Phreatobacter stygius]|uniref:assimilatory sulfite reductase (NADPH) n=1 Tax=Phreatobacter stygius TaxID=1940610 RepID=A0A4D7BC38_9HYPH|nr:sulfite reductase subunit alpha [Phreatobacter stygius]QCI68203.1 sulfite reductase subunit alpha [Phreatobacter stygius]
MTAQPVTPILSLIPDNAPFSPEQRIWLSGFFSAALAPGGAPGAVAIDTPPDVAGAVLASNDDAPWHDPSMAIEARMQLAEGKPIAPRLMAAMAQQDCGQCGYNCADYANALAVKSEERLNLCVPGGKETLRMLKALSPDIGAVAAPGKAKAGAQAAGDGDAPAPSNAPSSAPSNAPLGRSREAPVEARFVSRKRLNAEGSEKETFHVEFDLTDSGLDYVVGDAFGLLARNDLGLVDQIIAMLGASHVTEVRGKALRDVLTEDVSLAPAPDTLFELISFLTGGAQRARARALATGEDPDGDAATLDVLAVLQKFPGVRPHPEAFVEALEPLQPRLYSISSSIKANPGRVSLTVDAVRYVVGKRRRMGLASTYLGYRAEPGQTMKVYVQRAHAFALPADPATPVIMVGPGTGVAPFRAFLQDRWADKAAGPNWLFYGHQRQATDFFYADEMAAMKKAGVLSRLSLAWSRDGADKVYVQDRMRENGVELWRWLADGAHFYVCGDAKRMARDVEAALVDVVAKHGARSIDEAVSFVQALKKAGRYQADVY